MNLILSQSALVSNMSPLPVCLPGSVGDGCCPLDWDLLGSSCYFFSKTGLSWDEARDWCNGQESHLVVLNTDEDWVRHKVTADPGLVPVEHLSHSPITEVFLLYGGKSRSRRGGDILN